MFKRPHHQSIAKLLEMFDEHLLEQTGSLFGGGTAIVLALEEYRESVDIDFLVAAHDGYRLLRNLVSSSGLGRLLPKPVEYLREVRADRYGVRTVVKIDGQPIKIEFVTEDRISIHGSIDIRLGVRTLSREDMYAEKLLANADRGLDRSTLSRDLIDIAMMVRAWGPIPGSSWSKARGAYGQHVDDMYKRAVSLVLDGCYLASCLQKMEMSVDLLPEIRKSLNLSNLRHAPAMKDSSGILLG
jgi:hypothetical protein